MSDDDYDFFYDETEDLFCVKQIVEIEHLPKVLEKTRIVRFEDAEKSKLLLIQNEKYRDEEKSKLQRLTNYVVLEHILPYFRGDKKALSTIAGVSQHFQKILYSSEAEQLWNHYNGPFQFCIDTYCMICLLKKKKKKGNISNVLGLLQKCPINKLKLHCFITDIPGIHNCNLYPVSLYINLYAFIFELYIYSFKTDILLKTKLLENLF